MSKFCFFLFGNPTNKTVTGTAYMWGLLKANHLGPIVIIDQSKILSHSQVQFITLLFGGAHLCCAFYQPRQAAPIWCRKTNWWDNPTHFDFFATNCTVWTVWSHILSTGGDALTTDTSSVSMCNMGVW